MTGQPGSGRPPWEPIPPVLPPPVPPPPRAGSAGLRRPPASAEDTQPWRLPAGAARPRRRRPGGWLTTLPYLAVLAIAGTGLWWTWLSPQRARGGTFAVAGALFVAALARLVLPEKWAGLLASRKRFTDVVTLVALAAGLLAAGLLLPTSS